MFRWANTNLVDNFLEIFYPPPSFWGYYTNMDFLDPLFPQACSHGLCMPLQLMSSSITRIADFLNAFSKSCSGRLSYLDSRLTAIERKVSFLESKVEIVDEQPARQYSSNSKIEEEFQQQQPLPHRTSDESAEEDESLSQARC